MTERRRKSLAEENNPRTNPQTFLFVYVIVAIVNNCVTQVSHVSEKMAELENVGKEIEKEKNKPIDPDELITPIDGLSQQMLTLSAEVAAIEDTMYYLDRALANDTIDLTVHLKEIRKLARKQFLAKAHLKKIGEHIVGPTFRLR